METHQAEKLMKKIEELEAGQARLKQEVTRLKHCGGSGGLEGRRVQQRSHSLSPRRRQPEGLASRTFGHSFSSPLRRSVDACDPKGAAGGGLSDWQYRRILQSMGQSVHIFDLEGKIIYWNRSAEQLYGYAASEAIGQDAVRLIVDACDIDATDSIMNRIRSGESWAGRFPVKNKLGEHFLAIATNSPFYNDDGGLAGIICVSSDSRNFIEVASSTGTGHTSLPRINPITDIGADIQHPISKITALVGEFRDQCSGLRSADAKKIDHREDLPASDASTYRGDAQPNHFSHTWAANEEQSPGKAEKVNANIAEENLGIKKILNSKAEARVSKKDLGCHRKGNEHNGLYFKHEIACPYSQNENECNRYHPKSNGLVQAVDNDGFRVVNRDGYGPPSSFNANSINSASSSGSTSNSAIQKDIEAHCLDYEILWEDLTIGEPIGQAAGSCGTVHHALWYGSDVAVKVFSRQEYSDEAILSFRQEVSVMKRLRHPNILLFMGAVTSPRHLCIITEFLPRGSLFRLLQRSTIKLDWRRRLHIALDIGCDCAIGPRHELSSPLQSSYHPSRFEIFKSFGG